jgi:hypothetical protein
MKIIAQRHHSLMQFGGQPQGNYPSLGVDACSALRTLLIGRLLGIMAVGHVFSMNKVEIDVNFEQGIP